MQALMLFFAFILCFAMTVNMSIAIVVMTDPAQTNRRETWSHGATVTWISTAFPDGLSPSNGASRNKEWYSRHSSGDILHLKCLQVNWRIGYFGPAAVFIALAHVSAGNVTLAVTLLTLALGINETFYSGYMLGSLDMAPIFAGTLMGISSTFSTVMAIVAPLVIGVILKDEAVNKRFFFFCFFICNRGVADVHGRRLSLNIRRTARIYFFQTDLVEWRYVFYLSARPRCTVANVFYMIFGSSDKQQWNEPRSLNIYLFIIYYIYQKPPM
ncbi:unnamed protein product, partial [Iphiclides podalirius]